MTEKNLMRELAGDPDVADQLFSITVRLKKGKSITLDLSADIGTDYDLIEEELTNSPAKYAFWSTILSKQRLVVDLIKIEIDTQKAKISRKFTDAANSGGLKVTKYQLDDLVASDDKIIKLQHQLAVEDSKLSSLYGVTNALKAKLDNLRSLAGFAKIEMQNP